jgi:hypothetical protein
METPANDIRILRELASKVAEIAALPCHSETRQAWIALNGLRPVRPMVMIDQIPWHEMDVDGELTLACSDEFCCKLETALRQTLYRWRHMPADMVVDTRLAVPRAIKPWDFGFTIEEDQLLSDARNDVVSHAYHDQLSTPEDLDRIRTPLIEEDVAESARRLDLARHIFDGLLTVRLAGITPMFAPWDRIAELRGVQAILYDLADRPDFSHDIIERFTVAYLGLLDQLETLGILEPAQSLIHCTGAWTDSLPAAGFDPARPRAVDAWTAGMAQIFGSVSPAMHQEFDINYAVRWYARFGLGYYGCCEPLDAKMDIVRAIPRLRKVSMSPWTDIERGAEAIGRDFVYSRKPNPAIMIAQNWDPGRAGQELRVVTTACQRYACPLELILKDISTVDYRPQNLWAWERIAMGIAKS